MDLGSHVLHRFCISKQMKTYHALVTHNSWYSFITSCLVVLKIPRVFGASESHGISCYILNTVKTAVLKFLEEWLQLL